MHYHIGEKQTNTNKPIEFKETIELSTEDWGALRLVRKEWESHTHKHGGKLAIPKSKKYNLDTEATFFTT